MSNESMFDRQRQAIHLVGEGISLISEGFRILSDQKQPSSSDSIVLGTLRQLVLSQFSSLEPEVSGRGPNVCESDLPPNRYAPPRPLQVPVAEQLTRFVHNYKPGPRPYLRPNLPEPEAGPHQEPPAMTPPQREITSSPPQREITSSPFEGIRIKLRHQLGQRDRGESN